MEDLLEKYLREENEIKPEAILKTNGSYLGKEVFIIAKDEFNLIFGKKGNGKSWFVSHFVQQLIFEKSEWIIRFNKPICTLVIDTEQGEAEIYRAFIKSCYKGKTKDEIRELKIKFPYRIFSIKNESDKIGAIENIISKVKSEFPDYHLFVILDNLTHAVKDIMSFNNESLSRINIARGNNTTFLAVLHTNHKPTSNTDNATGVIGSMAENTAAMVWKVEKKDDKYILENKKTRYHDDSDKVILSFTLKSEKDICYFDNCELVKGSQNCKIENISRLDMTKAIVLDILNTSDPGNISRIKKNVVEAVVDLKGYSTSAVYEYIKELEDMKIIKVRDGEIDLFEAPF
jgi:hypothetical protein